MESMVDPKAEPESSGQIKILVREMPADLETPVSAFLKLKQFGAKVLLESVESGRILGRYSFIGIAPRKKAILSAEKIIISNGASSQSIAHENPSMPFESIKGLLQKSDTDRNEPLPPLLGGAVGYIGYDAVRFFEKIPCSLPDDLATPLAMFYFINTLLVFDHVQRKLKVISLVENDVDTDPMGELDAIIGALKSPLAYDSLIVPGAGGKQAKSNFTEAEFCRAVEKAKDYIRSGDVYQLVLSQRLTGETGADPFTIYRALRILNPSPYMFFLDFDDLTLIGSSPEALVKLENRTATVRPIAGTRRRGKDAAEDRKMVEELLADEKERAEHVMLVDLGRNDLGRCCSIGSVEVTELMEIEKYSHVIHMTSNVTGKLKNDLDQFDLFKATFPAGTVTGAPKIRAMQLIDELEKHQRGPYAGAIGYFSTNGDCDWCISIRTILMQGKKYHLQAGAGIVADSIPEREFKETQNKIAALKKAIEMAEEGF